MDEGDGRRRARSLRRIGSRLRKVIWWTGRGSTVVRGSTSATRRMAAKAIIASCRAKAAPMQTRGPALKGM